MRLERQPQIEHEIWWAFFLESNGDLLKNFKEKSENCILETLAVELTFRAQLIETQGGKG